MKYDLFEFNAAGMRWQDRAVRVAFLLAVIAVCALDLFVWRP
jgi:hypothetical protein